VVVLVNGGVVNEPVVPVPPPPEEVHEVLLVDDHVMTEVAPFAIEDGDATREMVGAATVLFPVFGLATVLCPGSPDVTTVDPFPPPHEARPETANSIAKIIFVRTFDPAVKLFDMIVFLQ
jgi:hypothetical protein